MAAGSDQAVHDVIATLTTLLVCACALFLLVRRLRRSRPELSVGSPLAVGLALRIVTAIGISVAGADAIRGPDEDGFLASAQAINASPLWSAPWGDALFGALHEFILALQLHVLDSPELALRITQASIAVAGIALLAAAVYELTGARAALIAASFLAVEPTNLFYSEVLHKEANMLLAAGLVALGGATLWRRANPTSLLPMALGCLIGVATRPYAGGFLAVGAVAVILHVAIRERERPGFRALIFAVVVAGLAAAPAAWNLRSPESLEFLDQRQLATTYTSANLPLERVDYSSPQAIAVSLPRRFFDVLLRPFPWQLGSVKQSLGLIGTLVAWPVLAWLLVELIRSRGRIMQRAGPLVYVGCALLIAYSLSAFNAGTAYRYRTVLVAIGICLLVALIHARIRERPPEPVPRRRKAPQPALRQEPAIG
jgi:hypothetical protein